MLGMPPLKGVQHLHTQEGQIETCWQLPEPFLFHLDAAALLVDGCLHDARHRQARAALVHVDVYFWSFSKANQTRETTRDTW